MKVILVEWWGMKRRKGVQNKNGEKKRNNEFRFIINSLIRVSLLRRKKDEVVTRERHCQEEVLVGEILQHICFLMGEPTGGKKADNVGTRGNNYKNKVLGYAVKDGIQ